MANVGYGIADAGDVTITNNTTGKIELYTPWANTMAFSNTATRFYAMGQNTRQIAWDGDKQETLTMELQIFELKWLPILLGGTGWTTGVTELFVREEKTVATSVTIGGTPKANTLSVWELEADNVGHKTEFSVVGSAPTAGQYSITGTTVTFNATDVGKKVAFFYMKDSASTAQTYSVKADEYPKAYSIDCVSTVRRQYDGVDEELQIHIGNARPMADMTLNFSESEASTLSIVYDLFSDGDGNMITFTKA